MIMKKCRQGCYYLLRSDRTKLFFIGSFLLMIIAACGSSYPLFKPIESDVNKVNMQNANVSLADLETGYKLYSSNCGGCHVLHAPSSRSQSDWNKILLKMFPKTELNPEQQELVRQYLFSKI